MAKPDARRAAERFEPVLLRSSVGHDGGDALPIGDERQGYVDGLVGANEADSCIHSFRRHGPNALQQSVAVGHRLNAVATQHVKVLGPAGANHPGPVEHCELDRREPYAPAAEWIRTVCLARARTAASAWAAVVPVSIIAPACSHVSLAGLSNTSLARHRDQVRVGAGDPVGDHLVTDLDRARWSGRFIAEGSRSRMPRPRA